MQKRMYPSRVRAVADVTLGLVTLNEAYNRRAEQMQCTRSMDQSRGRVTSRHVQPAGTPELPDERPDIAQACSLRERDD